MMLQKLGMRRRAGRGFTLVELAIVLAVSSLLFAGLWRLIAGANTQLRDQNAADQHKQLIAAVRGYLASGEGVGLLSGTIGPSANYTLPLPTGPGCAGLPPAGTAPHGFCDFLPPGFTSATVNSYGQPFAIQILTAGTMPQQNYSFMIRTNSAAAGSTVIPDSSGGRIASMIGGDGGFVYAVDVCGGLGLACGAYGSWNVSPTAAALSGGYGFPTAVFSAVASRTVVGLGATPADPWLARDTSLITAGNVGAPPTPNFNTLQADTHMDGTHSFNMKASPLNLQGGTIFGDASGGSSSSGAIMGLKQLVMNMVPADASSAVVINGPVYPPAVIPCKKNVPADPCPYAVQVNGNQTISGLLYANILWAETFIYDPSDIRLKHDIKPIEHPLEDLSKINAVSFALNQNNEKKMGVIAQDVEKVYPELVHGIGEGYKGVDYMGFIGPLIGAVNELKAANDKLREQLNEQARDIKRLQKRAHQ